MRLLLGQVKISATVVDHYGTRSNDDWGGGLQHPEGSHKGNLAMSQGNSIEYCFLSCGAIAPQEKKHTQ